VKALVIRAGWIQPVGVTAQSEIVQPLKTLSGVEYLQIRLLELRLSHPAVLHLLQGASYRQLLDDVLLVTSSGAILTQLCVTDTVPLHKPPFILKNVVLAHVLRRPDNIPDEMLQQELLLAGLCS
jgi:hypothetical protein